MIVVVRVHDLSTCIKRGFFCYGNEIRFKNILNWKLAQNSYKSISQNLPNIVAEWKQKSSHFNQIHICTDHNKINIELSTFHIVNREMPNFEQMCSCLNSAQGSVHKRYRISSSNAIFANTKSLPKRKNKELKTISYLGFIHHWFSCFSSI